jgi:hypothetical protein
MNRLVKMMLHALLTVSLLGCAMTKINEGWRNPEATAEDLDFEKILVMAIVDDIVTRRVAEDQLAQFIERPEAVPSYTVLTEADLQDLEGTKAKIQARDFDGVVTMRLVRVDEGYSHVAGRYPSSYNSLWGYYSYAWSNAYQPGSAPTNTIVTMEINIYSIDPDKLLWSGISETFNPANARQVVDEVATAVGKQLEKQGLVTAD